MGMGKGGTPDGMNGGGQPAPNMASDLGGRPMAPGENMAADQAEAARSMAVNFAQEAAMSMASHLVNLRGVGSNGQYFQQAMEATRSKSDILANGPGDAGPPTEPGFVYMSHLFRRSNAAKKIAKRMKEKKTGGTNIYTDHTEALKAAMGALGIYSDKNPGGMPIDPRDAKKLWFGSDTPDPGQESEWRTMIEMGDKNVDPKRIRKFVNYDGSMTWELLNEDKTVMSRFTLGEYKGSKIFTQGGYAKFSDLLKKAKQELGPDENAEFDQVRGALTGGI